MEELFIKLLQIFLISLGVGVGAYYAKYTKHFILWIKGGVEDGDGKLENKDLQIAFFSTICAFMIISIALWGTEYPDVAWYGAFGGAGVLYSINRIVDGYKSTHNGDKSKKDES
jgi:hypothetical protein